MKMEGRERKRGSRAACGPARVAAVDLFCGVGGLTHGFIQSGLPVIAGIDLDPACSFAYEFNNNARFIHRDLREITSQELSGLYPVGAVKVLLGCAPCQSFSRYARRYQPPHEEKWALLTQFSRLVTETLPDAVSMENVPELKLADVFTDFVAQLKNAGYHVWHSDVYCPAYGVPQHRTRLVLLASRHGELQLPHPTHGSDTYPTVRSAIGHLPPLHAGEKSTADPLHRAAALTALNAERIRHSRPGGCWREWPGHLIAACHRTERGKTYPAVYGRMEWDKPSPTVTTQFFGYGNGRFGHPVQNRALSLREGAVLQSFPDSYAFAAPDAKLTFNGLGRLIGNAVPVRLGAAVGRAIRDHLAGVDYE